MRLSSVFVIPVCVVPAMGAILPPAMGAPTAEGQVKRLVEDIKADVLKFLDHRESRLRKCGDEAPCTARNVVFRREYGSLSQPERLDYVNAVRCLQALPSRTPPSVAPGARSRFDDFVALHILQTPTVHFTGNFLPWHRWFLHLYEKALRDECGYTGHNPYWDWPKYASAPHKSPIFNGDPYSLGGNGDFLPHDGAAVEIPVGNVGKIHVPPGLGGGFVTTGPLANMTVNLGPVKGPDGTVPGPDRGLGYNPRRLRRDVGPALNTRHANYTTVLSLLLKPSIDDFRLLAEGNFIVHGVAVEIGPHVAAHFTIGGDPGSDIFAAAGDPAFYLHHAMMDRVWALWQALDPKTRRYQLGNSNYGHITWANVPPSRRTGLNDTLNMGSVGDSTGIADVMDTLSGPFCYLYL